MSDLDYEYIIEADLFRWQIAQSYYDLFLSAIRI